MKALRILIGIVLSGTLLFGGWVVLFRQEWLREGPEAEAPEPPTDVPIHVAKVKRMTLHKYVEGYGVAGPAQLYAGAAPSSARMASPVAGVVTEVKCAVGEKVEKGTILFQLDDRALRAEEAKAEAALASARAGKISAEASVLKLKTSTRPEQISIAQTAVQKAKQAADFAAQNHERQKALAKDELAATKQVEESASLLAAAREDLATAEKQLALLKNTPAPEELAEAEAKVKESAAKITEGEKALSAAALQRSLLTIKSPLSATVVRLNIYPGEQVDPANVIIELVDLDRLEISAQVPSSDLALLRPGQPVDIYCAVAKAQEKEKESDDNTEPPAFQSKLTSVGWQVDPKTDLATARVALPPKSGVQPGQSARVRVTVDEHRDCLVVPIACVFRDKTDIQVIATIENNKSELQNVKPGLTENGWVEIKNDDIKEGMTVAAEGAYGLPETTKVHILPDAKKPPTPEKK